VDGVVWYITGISLIGNRPTYLVHVGCPIVENRIEKTNHLRTTIDVGLSSGRQAEELPFDRYEGYCLGKVFAFLQAAHPEVDVSSLRDPSKHDHHLDVNEYQLGFNDALKEPIASV